MLDQAPKAFEKKGEVGIIYTSKKLEGTISIALLIFLLLLDSLQFS